MCSKYFTSYSSISYLYIQHICWRSSTSEFHLSLADVATAKFQRAELIYCLFQRWYKKNYIKSMYLSISKYWYILLEDISLRSREVRRRSCKVKKILLTLGALCVYLKSGRSKKDGIQDWPQNNHKIRQK